jgi:signal transduction histidine kinase
LLDWFWDNTQRYASLLLLGGAVLLVFYGRELESLPVRFSAVLSVGAVSSTAILHFLPLTDIPITAALGLFTLTGTSYFVAYEEYRLFDRRPSAEAIGREVVVGEMPELVVVVDSDEQILDMNPAAQRALGTTLEECLWHRVPAVFDRTLDELRDTETITVEGATTRYYDISVAPVAGGANRQVGHAIVLHDITDERRQQQRLEVLNRILRHNVRNDMTVVIGLAETIAAGTQPPEKAGGIVEKASELTDISQKARTLENMMAPQERDGHVIDLSEVVRKAVRQFDSEYESVDVRFEGETAHIRAMESATEAIVENLVENACEHNDSDEPWVEVTVAEDGDEALVRVTDNGPGLPDHERETVLSGEETDLQHGSGLGLWIVVWGVEQTGGDLAFDTDRDGTTITVRFPRSEPDSESRERPLLEY